MSRWPQYVLLGVALGCGSVSCKGYFPLRRPSSGLWTPASDTAFSIQLPIEELADNAEHLQRDGVGVAIHVFDPTTTQRVFGVNLLRYRVQPVLVVIRNENPDPYVFRKAGLDRHYIPAANAARVAVVHPVVRLTRTVKWLAWFVPGVLFETFVEPASTIDFPGVEEAAQRPPRVNTRRIIDEFVAHEIADEEIPPGGTLSGVLFIRPPKLGSVIPVTLLNARTQQPLVFDAPMPLPLYAEQHDYPYAYEQVWDGVVKAAGHLNSWKVMSADKERGALTVEAGVKMWPWRTARPLTIAVEKVEAADTRVSLEHPLHASDTRSYGAHSVTVDRFFGELAGKFPSLHVEQAEDDGGESPTL